MKLNARCLIASMLTLCVLASSVQATTLAYYPLGEAGSVAGANNLPQDTFSTHDFVNPINTATVVAVAGGAPGSTFGLDFAGTPNEGYYYVDANFMPANDFRIEIWANPDTAHDGQLFSLGEVAGSLWIGITAAGNWTAAAEGVGYIGAAAGAGQPATLNDWTKLAIENLGGTLRFYIDDVDQGSPLVYTNLAANGGQRLHLGVAPGGSKYFDGTLDELTISAVPEPAGLTLIGLAIVGMVRFARRRQG